MASAVLAARLLLALVFAVAGVAKLLDLEGSREALRGFGVADRLARVLGALVPLAELSVAVALVFHPTALWGAVGAFVLLATFSAGIANALRRGRKPDCHCFGQLHSAPAGRETLARNIGLAALAGFVAVEGPGPSAADWVADRTPAELVAIGTATAAIALAALSLRLWADKRRLKQSLDSAYAALDEVPVGLPVGAPAPAFALSAARGEGQSLDDLLATGLPVLVVFVDPGCGPCKELMPKLGRWQATLAQRLPIAVIGRGDREEHRRQSEKFGVHVLIDEDSKVAGAYRLRDTPAAVLVGPDGRLASDPVNSGFQIEGLIRMSLRRDGAAPEGLRSEVARPASS